MEKKLKVKTNTSLNKRRELTNKALRPLFYPSSGRSSRPGEKWTHPLQDYERCIWVHCLVHPLHTRSARGTVHVDTE